DDFLRLLPRALATFNFGVGIRGYSHPRPSLLAICSSLRAYPGAARVGVLIALGPMNFRSRAPLQHPGIQLAPLVDVLMMLLIFFLLTWRAARTGTELDVIVLKA